MGKCDFDVTHRKTGPTDVWARDTSSTILALSIVWMGLVVGNIDWRSWIILGACYCKSRLVPPFWELEKVKKRRDGGISVLTRMRWWTVEGGSSCGSTCTCFKLSLYHRITNSVYFCPSFSVQVRSSPTLVEIMVSYEPDEYRYQYPHFQLPISD